MKDNSGSLIIRGESGKELIVFQPVKKSFNKKLIPVSDNVSSILAGAGVNAGIATLSGNGLFRATVNPASLMIYEDGTIGSIVVNGAGKITGHAGFQSVSCASIFAPMLAFQLASAITGQYYFNLLSKQMEYLSQSINKIISYLEDKDNAVISETQNRLEEISIQMRYRTTDDDVLFRIHQYIDKVSEIAALYRILWEKQLDEFEQKTGEKTWQAFVHSVSCSYWNIFSSSLHVLSYAHALEFVIRLEKNTKMYLALQQEYSERFKGYAEFQVLGRNVYLPHFCKKTIEKTASCIAKISEVCSIGERKMWISEKDRRALAQGKETSAKFLDEFFSENIQLSEFNTQFKENTNKVFQNISNDNALFFDASTGKYYLEEK